MCCWVCTRKEGAFTNRAGWREQLTGQGVKKQSSGGWHGGETLEQVSNSIGYTSTQEHGRECMQEPSPAGVQQVGKHNGVSFLMKGACITLKPCGKVLGGN